MLQLALQHASTLSLQSNSNFDAAPDPPFDFGVDPDSRILLFTIIRIQIRTPKKMQIRIRMTVYKFTFEDSVL